MELERSFSEAFIHRLAERFRDDDPWSAHRVAGRGLRPFCLWHLMLLQQIGSPLLSNPGAMSGEDVLRAVSIFRCRFLEANVAARWTASALWKLSGKRIEQERAALLEYVEDFLQRPEFSVAAIGRGGKSIRLGPPPEVIYVASAVIFATGWSERFVWEMPIGAAYWYHALSRRQREPIDFMTPEERAFQDELEAAGIKAWEPTEEPDPEDDDA